MTPKGVHGKAIWMQPMSNTVTSNRTLQSENSEYNALNFMVVNTIRRMVNTAEVVQVMGVEAGGSGATSGYVDVRPLVCQTDNENNVIPPTTFYHLPYSRVQGGKAALVIDPIVGDIGIAIFTKRDSSNVVPGTDEPVQPGSFRVYSQADGFYIGGFLNQTPDTFLELDQNGNAVLTAPTRVTVNTADCVINADNSIAMNCQTFAVNASVSAGINAPTWSFNTFDGTGTGIGTIRANLTQIGSYNQQGNFTQTGSITSSGDHQAGGISLTSHVHGGVERGNSSTNGPS